MHGPQCAHTVNIMRVKMVKIITHKIKTILESVALAPNNRVIELIVLLKSNVLLFVFNFSWLFFLIIFDFYLWIKSEQTNFRLPKPTMVDPGWRKSFFLVESFEYFTPVNPWQMLPLSISSQTQRILKTRMYISKMGLFVFSKWAFI